MEDFFLLCIFVQFSAVQASFNAFSSLHCLLFIAYTAFTVFSVSQMTLTIAHFIYLVHSEIQISDYPPGNALTALTELPRSGQYCELGHDLLASKSCHRIVNSERSISTKNFIGKQSPVYQQNCANEVKDTFHSVQEAQRLATYQSIPFLSSTLTCYTDD